MIYYSQVETTLSRAVRNQVERGIAVIRSGGLVVFPTDTLYGLGAGAYIESAISRVYEVKRRPFNMALPLLLGDIAQIHEVAENLPTYAWRLVDAFLPGSLTLIVKRTRIVKDIITAGGNTVAIRIPNHPVPIALIQGSGMPIVGTSANLSGQPNVINAQELKAQLGSNVDLIIEGGPTPGGTESTVVDVTGEQARIVREGAIVRAQLVRVVELAN